MKKFLTIIVAFTSLSSFANGIICTAQVSVSPQIPGTSGTSEMIWLKPTTPIGKELTAEIKHLNAFVKATVSNNTEIVLSARELNSNLAVSLSGSVLNGDVRLILTSRGAVATVKCRN